MTRHSGSHTLPFPCISQQHGHHPFCKPDGPPWAEAEGRAEAGEGGKEAEEVARAVPPLAEREEGEIRPHSPTHVTCHQSLKATFIHD